MVPPGLPPTLPLPLCVRPASKITREQDEATESEFREAPQTSKSLDKAMRMIRAIQTNRMTLFFYTGFPICYFIYRIKI